MHELSIALSIVDVAVAEAERHQGSVVAIHLKIGPLAGVMKESLVSAYDLAREGTPLAQAELVVEEVPLIVHCPACADDYSLTAVQLLCPVCGAPTPEVVSGRELEIQTLEIES